MTPRYVRNQPGPRENATAALVSGILAAGVGLTVFYLTRLILAREPAGPSSASSTVADGDDARTL